MSSIVIAMEYVIADADKAHRRVSLADCGPQRKSWPGRGGLVLSARLHHGMAPSWLCIVQKTSSQPAIALAPTYQIRHVPGLIVLNVC